MNARRPQDRRPAALVVLATLLLAGCVTEPSPRARAEVRSNATAADRLPARPPIPERERVLVDYREAASALRAGNDAEAKAKLDDAILRIGGIITNDAAAAKARSLFSAESTKNFIGEPYERAMAYYYRGILYWHDGEPDNARACFRSAAVVDSDPVNHFDADYVLLDYLDGLVTTKLGGDGGEALARAQRHAGERKPLPPYATDANVLIFAEYGYGPHKYAAGQYGEQLRFRTTDSPSRAARLVLENGRRIVPLPAYDDLNYQATTRGGRVMDYILANKAVFKATTNTAADIALAGAAIAANEARRDREPERDRGRDRNRSRYDDGDRDRRDDNDTAQTTAIGLGILGVIGKIASSATEPQADTREWNNLPQRLSFAALKLPPGDYIGRLEFLDRDGAVLTQRSRDIRFQVPSDQRDAVVFLSELKG